MGGFLTGTTQSGTPPETAQQTKDISNLFGNYLTGRTPGTENPYNRFTSQAIQNIVGPGFSPELFSRSIMDSLVSPADATKGLFASLQPFEERASNEAAANIMESYGTTGGRFGRNSADAAIRARGEVANQFEKTRQEGLLKAADTRNAAVGQLLQAILGAQGVGTEQLGQMLSFFKPGEPIYQQSPWPGLMSTAMMAAAMA